MTYFHSQEQYQVGVVEAHGLAHPASRLLVQFADGESYVCVFDASWESENGCELEIEMDDPRYDEFYQVGFVIVEIIQDGERRYQQTLTIDYRDFPTKITDLDADTVIYPRNHDE